MNTNNFVGFPFLPDAEGDSFRLLAASMETDAWVAVMYMSWGGNEGKGGVPLIQHKTVYSYVYQVHENPHLQYTSPLLLAAVAAAVSILFSIFRADATTLPYHSLVPRPIVGGRN